MSPIPSDQEIVDRAIAEIKEKAAEIERLRTENERLRGVVRATFDLYHEAKTDLDDVRDERDMLRTDLAMLKGGTK